MTDPQDAIRSIREDIDATKADLAVIRARLKRMPTTSDIFRIGAIAQGIALLVIGALAGIAAWVTP